jgi:hypothetical protein
VKSVAKDHLLKEYLEAELLTWSSVLDYRVEYTESGAALELVTFPGVAIPQLPSSAKLNVRLWNPNEDIPFCMHEYAEKILEKELEYVEPVSAINKKIAESYGYGGKMCDFYSTYRRWYDTLHFDWASPESDVLWNLIGSDTLAGEKCEDNEYLNKKLPIEIDFGDGHKIKIEKSTKPMRAFFLLYHSFSSSFQVCPTP